MNKKHKFKNIEGKRFGKLIALGEIEIRGNTSKNRLAYRLCECDCGNSKYIRQSNLTTGHTKSCGKCERYEDLSGKQFGDLLVLNKTKKHKNNIYWVVNLIPI